jgi:hypothetical protein
MPQNIAGANPVDVLPALVTVAFNEQFRFEAIVNQSYADGSSDRAALTQNSRSFFRASTKLSAAQWLVLRNFFWGHIGKAFYFYFGRETQPPFTVDMSGNSTTGRYTVVFDGAYGETYAPGVTKGDAPYVKGMGQSQTTFGLREVA